MRHLLYSLLALTLLFSSPAANACTCILQSNDLQEIVRDAYSNAATVFYAEAIEVRDTRRLRWGPLRLEPIQRVQWRILRTWKGSHGVGEVLSSATMTECCACGVSVRKGEKHIFYLSSDGGFAVTTCSVGQMYRGELPEQIRILDTLVEK